MSKLKRISTDNFKIENNILSFRDTIVQISNISQISIAPVPKKRFNFLSIVIIVMGFLTIQVYRIPAYIGIVMISVGMIYILFYFYNNTDEKYLSIKLNSGSTYYIMCQNEKFLRDAMKVIKYCINNHSTKMFQIDFTNCNITNSPIIQGDENEVMQLCQ